MWHWLGFLDEIFECKFLIDCFDKFRGIVVARATDFVPRQSKKTDGKPPWHKNPPRGLLNRRHEAWTAYKRVRSLSGRTSTAAYDALANFSTVNKRVRNFEVLSQASYEHSMIERFRECPKLLHSSIRSKKVAPMAVVPLQGVPIVLQHHIFYGLCPCG